MTIWPESNLILPAPVSLKPRMSSLYPCILLSVLQSSFIHCSQNPVSDGESLLGYHKGTSLTLGFLLAFTLCRPAAIVGSSRFKLSFLLSVHWFCNVFFSSRVVGLSQTSIYLEEKRFDFVVSILCCYPSLDIERSLSTWFYIIVFLHLTFPIIGCGRKTAEVYSKSFPTLDKLSSQFDEPHLPKTLVFRHQITRLCTFSNQLQQFRQACYKPQEQARSWTWLLEALIGVRH